MCGIVGYVGTKKRQNSLLTDCAVSNTEDMIPPESLYLTEKKLTSPKRRKTG